MNSPLVSIVMSIYDTQDFLEECLASIQAQTMPDFECLMVDDGSPDRCGQIIDQWAAKDPRFIPFHKENGGVVTGWRMGIQNARGRWLVIVDSDDKLTPWALESELAAQNSAPHSMVVWNWSSNSADLAQRPDPIKVTHRSLDQLGQMYLESMLYYTWGRLFDLDLIRSKQLLPPLGLIYGSDLIFCVDYMKAALAEGTYQDFLQIDSPLYFYRTDNGTSLTTRLRPCYCADEMRTCQYLLELFDNLAQIPQADFDRVLLHRLRTLAEGIGYVLTQEQNLSAQDAHAKASALLADSTMQDLLERCAQRKLYSPYLGPLRRGNLAALARVYTLKQQHLRWYHRYFWAGYWLHFARTGRRDAPMF